VTSKAIMRSLAAEFPNMYTPDGEPRADYKPSAPRGMLRHFAKRAGFKVQPAPRARVAAISTKVELDPEVRNALADIRSARAGATNTAIVREALLVFAKSLTS
jgi:hypothetical protein